MMNRIKTFHKLGILIHLHYFSYNERGNPNELNQFCETINVYRRENIQSGFSFTTPYIISSRINEDLIHRLQQDEYPILLEGIHCTGILPRLNRQRRKIVVRMHNEESVYYKELARAEHGLLKKLFFYNESRLLKKYSHHLPDDCLYACISENDVHLLKHHYKLHNVEFLPAFPTWQNVRGPEGQGNLCLYHGNLSVPENEEAAAWLICKVFTKARIPFVIAGKKPTRQVTKISRPLPAYLFGS